MIGVFDSGLGGMSVVVELRRLLPHADIVYFADSGRAPYGPRPLDEVRSFSEQITSHLLGAGADMIVVACNSASAASLHELRDRHPDVPFVGMEPAVKPAVASTNSGVIGVLTTAATFQGALFASVIDRFATDVTVEASICDGWVELVEEGQVDGPLVEEQVRRYVEPLLGAGADTLVLGCTHYPFLAPVITRVAGPGVSLVDPAPAVARQARRIAENVGAASGSGALRVETSGDPVRVRSGIEQLTGLAPPTTAVTLGHGMNTHATGDGLDPWDAALLDALGPRSSEGLETLEQLAASSGISLPLLEALNREGFLMPRVAEPTPLFDPTEAETVRSGLSLVEAGLPLGELFDLARAMDEAMRPVAARAVDVFARFVRDSVEASAGSESDAAERLVEAFRTMLPATGRLVEHHFRALLIADARRRLGA